MKEQLLTYKQKLHFLYENDVFASEFMIAAEMEAQLDGYYAKPLDYSDEEFEKLCNQAHVIYLETENFSILQIVKATVKLFHDNKTADLSEREIRDQACWEE